MNIYDIAKEAGVSASSVSRVINNKPGVNAEARQKVNELLSKYKYTPNALARGLVNQSSKSIGVLISDVRTLHHTDSAYYIEQELSLMGYCCIMMSTGHSASGKIKAISELLQRQIEGLILIGSSFQTDEIKNELELHFKTTPIVIINGYFDLPNVYSVLANDEQGTSSCVKHLIKHGKTHLAFLRNSKTPSSFLKEAGFVNACKARGQDCEEFYTYETGSSLENGYALTKQIMHEHPCVNGIVYTEDLIAAGGVRAIIDLGLKIPQDIALIGIDNSLYAEICFPKLTSLDTMLKKQSITAAQTMLDVLNEKKRPHKVVISSEIVKRETV